MEDDDVKSRCCTVVDQSVEEGVRLAWAKYGDDRQGGECPKVVYLLTEFDHELRIFSLKDSQAVIKRRRKEGYWLTRGSSPPQPTSCETTRVLTARRQQATSSSSAPAN